MQTSGEVSADQACELLVQTITLRLKLQRPTLAKQRLYRELIRRTTSLANNLVAAGRPKGLTSKTAAPFLSAPLPSAVVNQVLRDVRAAKKVERFRVLPPSFNNQNLRLSRVGHFWTASFPTHAGRVRIMEDLAGIRLRGNRKVKDRGRSLHSWSFRRLQQFVSYKATLAGITVQWVVPANTSRACTKCGTIDKANRSGIQFACRSCGHTAHADAIGARNISRAISGLAAA